ncbi:MAG: hypothetical protein ACOCXZ_02950 [Chloroflexota bacterium]
MKGDEGAAGLLLARSNSGMTDEMNNIPPEETTNDAANDHDAVDTTPPMQEAAAPQNAAPRDAPPEQSSPPDMDTDEDQMQARLNRLGGEPAPVITPEEFARLQKAGQVYIDKRGRVRTSRRSDAEAGVSLRKRRAWYGR